MQNSKVCTIQPGGGLPLNWSGGVKVSNDLRVKERDSCWMSKQLVSVPTVIILLFSLSAALPQTVAQDFGENRSRFVLKAKKKVDDISIDGILSEYTWRTAEIATDFFRVLPIDSGRAIAQTEVMVAYDDQNLYMAIICHDTFPGKRPAESLRRDFSFGKNDNFLAFIDTYNDQTNGFSFGISAVGAQWDGLQADGGFVALDWDCKWLSEVQNDPEKWVAEFAIPFRSIRYQNGVKEWGINFSRLDLKTAEKSSWAPVPRQFQTANLAFTGTLQFEEPPPTLGTRFSLIPYASVRSSSQSQESSASNQFDMGLDAKVTLSTSLNVDLTVNPDFSQVEVDRQVTNLDRFELFFPERRQFFLENSDLFASLGSQNIRPFFSRRIGLNNPVYAGLRLSGKLDSDTRLGVMNVQTGSLEDTPAANFTVAALQRRTFERSNVGLFFINKNVTDKSSNPVANGYNRVIGIDYNLASADSRWTGKAFYHHSFSPGSNAQSLASAASIAYSTQRLTLRLFQEFVGKGFQAETGFVRRKGYYWIQPVVEYVFYPRSNTLANHGPWLEVSNFFNTGLRLTDLEISTGYKVQFLDRSLVWLGFRNTYIRLLEPFDPTNTGGEKLDGNESFQWSDATIFYSSNARSLFNHELSFQYGNYFNGERFAMDVELNYRFQPYGSIGLTGAFNKITLPDPFNSVDLVLIGPKLDITFNKNLFLTTFVQFNNQIDNINVNVRAQWRFAPVSDFFLVYTSNAFSETFTNKDRAVVAKISYYFN